jgi:hypothetical protein
MVSDRSEADSRWKQVEDLFFAAADLPENERTAFLDRTCAQDPELRRETESLLATESATETHANLSIASVIERAATALFDQTSMEGARFGAWQIIREVGRGGMGAPSIWQPAQTMNSTSRSPSNWSSAASTPTQY